MQGKSLYEYAVIRVVPRIERKEFINVGVILFCKKPRYMQMRYFLNESKLRCFSPDIDLSIICAQLRAFEKICNASPDGGEIAAMDMPERFRWLTAVRSSCVQTSRSHAGFTDDPQKTLEMLFREQVL